MKQKYSTIDYDWLTKPTGDAFVDAGGFVINYLWQHTMPDKDIDELIEWVTDIYVNEWNAKLNSFFLNSKITQPAFKASRKITETVNYFKRLIDETDQAPDGYCRITGRKTKLYKAGRDNSMMTGSGTFINFHHAFEKGIEVSKEVLIRLHFTPLGSIAIGGKLAIISSNDNAVSQYFMEQNIAKNLRSIATASAGGVVKSEYNIPANALFYFIDNLLAEKEQYKELDSRVAITLYHFTNYGPNPEIQLYHLPEKVFSFYAFCHRLNYKEDWNKFVHSHYYSSKKKGAVYDSATGNYVLEKKTKTDTIQYDEYKTWINWIYNKLLNNTSILPELLRWSKKGNKMNFDIIQVYQQNIRNMKKETVRKIKELAEFIVRDQDDHEVQKRIKRLNGAKNGYMLRRFLINEVVVKNHNEGNKEPIISVDEYVNYLFPDDQGWQELRDVLLIAVYQKLHELDMNVEIITEEENTNVESE